MCIVCFTWIGHDAEADKQAENRAKAIVSTVAGAQPAINAADRALNATRRILFQHISPTSPENSEPADRLFRVTDVSPDAHAEGSPLVAGLPELADYLRGRLTLGPDDTVYIGDMTGNALFSMTASPGEKPALSEDILQRVRESGSPRGLLHINEAGKRLLVAYDHLFSEENPDLPAAQVLFATPVDRQPDEQAARQRDIFLFLLAAVSMTLIPPVFGLALFSPPISKMLTASGEFGQGNFSSRLPGNFLVQELSELAETMNFMAGSIEKREGELVRAKEAADTASKAKGEFIANISHEIRTPLNAVIGMAYLTLKEDLTSRQRGYMNKIHFASSELLKIINNILELSRLDAGTLGLNSVSFSLRDIFADMQRRFSPDARNKGISLTFSIASDVPRYLAGDPLRLGQLLDHLLDNAVRCTESGTVTVLCAISGKSGPKVGLRISVKDSGPGLSAAGMTSLQRLFSGDSTPVPEREAGGPGGIGLLLAHKLALAMEGSLSVDSAPSRGCVFSFLGSFGVRDSSRVAATRALARMPVLAIDDELVSLSVLRELLENFGMDVTTEKNPQKALEILRQADQEKHPFRLVILDWRMPGIDGAEMTRRIKSRDALSSLPSVIMLSAYGWEGIPLQAEAAGIDSFLHKPLNESVLLDTIMNLLHPQDDHDFVNSLRAEASAPHPDAASFAGIRVLQVEDNDINRRISHEILSSAGLDVALAESGRASLEFFDAASPEPPFAMVFMDLQMPYMDGFEAARRIRALDAAWAKDLPIIAMTAHSRDFEREARIAAGFNDYVAKPVAVEELFGAIRRWLPPKPVTEREVAGRIADLYAKLRRGDPSAKEAVVGAEQVLSAHLHEGRMNSLKRLLLNDDLSEAANVLQRLNNILGFMEKR